MRNGGEGSGGPIAPASCTYQGLPQAKISGATEGVFSEEWRPAPFLLAVVGQSQVAQGREARGAERRRWREERDRMRGMGGNQD